MRPPMGYGMMRGHGPPGMSGPPPGMREKGSPPERMLESDHPSWENIRSLDLEEKQTQQIKEIRNKLLLETIKQKTTNKSSR